MRDDVSKIFNGWHFRTFLITLAAAAAGYLLFMVWGGWDAVLEASYQVGFKGLAVALSLSLLNYLLRFIRWQVYLHALGVYIPPSKNLWIYIAGFALTTTPGKAGEAVRSVFMKDYQVPYRVSLGAFFSERASDLIAVVLLSALSLWDYPKAQPLIVGVALVMLAVILVVQKKSWLMAIEEFAKARLPHHFAHGIEFCIEMILSFRKCFTFKWLIVGIALGMAAWTAEGLALFYLLSLLNVDIGVSTTIFVYAFSLLVGSVTFLPGGLGGTEVSMSQLLAFFGAPFATTVAVTIIIRLATLWFSVVLGLIALSKCILRR